MASARPAVLFDVDGTLVDSNYLHVSAWLQAFVDAGLSVEAWRIHRGIGMDGTTLLRTLTDDADDTVIEDLKARHGELYTDTQSLLKPLPGSRELLQHVADLGLQVVLATSAPEDELAVLRRVLDSDAVVSEVTSTQDVDTAKPEPDIVAVALQRAGVTAEDAVFVGDAVWDCEAAARAGVACIGLLSGGTSRGELLDAGAGVVFAGPSELLARLDETYVGTLARRLSAHQ